MITIEQGNTIGFIGFVCFFVFAMITGLMMAQEISARTKEANTLSAKVAYLTKRLEIEKAEQPDAILLTTPQVTTETKDEYVKRNTAPINRIKAVDVSELKVGDTVIYASGARGRVLRIAPMENSWVVETTHGRGEYGQWGTEAHEGDNIKGVVR